MASATKVFGESIARKEDDRFLTGRGNYVADMLPPGTLFAKFVRSPYAHARIIRINTAKARKLPISATRESRRLADTLRGNLFVSASLEILQESQQVLRYGLARDLIEDRPDMAADVSLQAGGQSIRLGPGRITRYVGAPGPCLVHFVRARHFAPAILLVRVAVHNPSPITH